MADRRPSYRDVRPVRPLVSEDEAWEAKAYLDETAHDFAVAYADVDFETYMLRQIEAMGVVYSDAKASAARLYESRCSEAYGKQIERVRKAQLAFKELEAKRTAATLKIEVWRTVSANSRVRDALEASEPGSRRT